jgi:hypothetical protein
MRICVRLPEAAAGASDNDGEICEAESHCGSRVQVWECGERRLARRKVGHVISSGFLEDRTTSGSEDVRVTLVLFVLTCLLLVARFLVDDPVAAAAHS